MDTSLATEFIAKTREVRMKEEELKIAKQDLAELSKRVCESFIENDVDMLPLKAQRATIYTLTNFYVSKKSGVDMVGTLKKSKATRFLVEPGYNANRLKAWAVERFKEKRDKRDARIMNGSKSEKTDEELFESCLPPSLRGTLNFSIVETAHVRDNNK